MDFVHSVADLLRNELALVISSTLARLFIAALLGGVIGFERQLRGKPAGLRTNILICFGAALFTVLSRELAGTPADSARIAAQIIPGIGFIGAGSILHSRATVTGLTTAATLFVVASVGMAVGGGLYITAVFSTVMILLSLAVLGRMEVHFAMRPQVFTYEVIGANVELMLSEVNRILEEQRLAMSSVHLASFDDHSRLVFSVECERAEETSFAIRLHESRAFGSVKALGATEQE